VMEQMNISDYDEARALLMKYGSVKKAVLSRDKGQRTKDE
jgi:hypothetical protein